MPHRTASVAALLYALFGHAAFAHEVRFGPQWSDLEFMDQRSSEVVIVVDVLEVRAGRGRRVANRITGRVNKERERSGVLAEEQYRDLLRSVNEGRNRRAFQSTVETVADRIGATSWTSDGESGRALVAVGFGRDDSGLWEGTVEFLSFDDDNALRAEYRAVANRFFLRGKRRGDWLLMVTVLDDTPRDTPADPWQQPPSWSPDEALGDDPWP
ncbi:MAG: hypothetical protein AAF211_17685 [Myxococcota bacterium]